MARSIYSPASVSDLPLFGGRRSGQAGSGAAFSGSNYDARQDEQRLAKQIEAVYSAIYRKGWRTLAQIAADAKCGEASASAQLRNLRKPAHGGHTIEKRRSQQGSGLFEYRHVPVEQAAEDRA